MELSPRTAPPEPSTGTDRWRRSAWAYVVLVAVLAGVAIVTYQGLTSASLYFYNADEAVEQRADLGDRRFRLQGAVQDDVRDTAAGVEFTVRFNNVEVSVRHAGDPPELFQPGIPVVLEGRWDASGEAFDSDRILVKHSEEYQADNGERLVDAADGDADRADAP